MTQKYNLNICYTTSDENDPVLKFKKKGLTTYNIGEGIIRTIMFKTIEANIFITTLNDLQNFFLKRSPFVKNYIYVFHCLQSTHKVYREKSFDNYDIIFCAGSHHLKEIKKRKNYEII